MQKEKHLSTILTISAGFLVLYLIFLFRKDKDMLWMLYVSGGVSIAGLISAKLAGWIHAAWFWIAHKLGFVMSKIILGIGFMILIIPLGLISRIFRKDFMFLKKRDFSYYKERNHVFASNDFNDPW